jgi:hypothetical protein
MLCEFSKSASIYITNQLNHHSMKKVITPLSRSKSAILFVLVAAGISMAVPACKKDDQKTINAVSEDEVNLVVTQAIASPQGGLVLQTNSAVDIAAGYGQRKGAKITTDECGQEFASEVGYSSEDNPNSDISFDFLLKFSYKLTCTAEQEPQKLTFGAAGHTNYTSPALAFSDSSVANFSITGLESDSTLLVFNQSFDRTGTLRFGSGDSARSFISTLNYVATNVKVNKETKKIVSGTAAVIISGVSGTGKTFNYAGTITYLGENKAKFAIKGGGTFDLNWLF